MLLSLLLQIMAINWKLGRPARRLLEYCIYLCPTAQAALPCAGGPVGGPGGLCHGAIRDGGEV